MRHLISALVLACLAVGGARAECRQALALGLDVSGSVDAREYRLQLDGLAQALTSPRVRNALLTLPAAPVELLVYEWSGPGDQVLLLPWTAVRSEADLERVIAVLNQTERRVASPGTALGVAMSVGVGFLAEKAQCWKRTLDISGDGQSNLGTRPSDIKAGIKDADLTINALVIGADAPSLGDLRQEEISQLSAYFRTNVIMGPNAFVETAIGFEDYAEAMARKLVRELDTLTLSLDGTRPDPDRRSQ